MPIIYRSDLTRNLTPDEVDENFRYLEALILGGQPLVPKPPTFTNFQDTSAGGTVTIVATDVPLASVVYALPGSSTFQPVPAGGVIQVGNVAGSVSTKSLAIGRYVESSVNTSPAFTAASLFPAQPQTYVTTAADYLEKFGQPWIGTYVGISRTSSNGSAATQAAANAQALTDATAQAKAAMVRQTAIVYVGSSATAVPSEADILSAQKQNWDAAAHQVNIPCPLAKPFPFVAEETLYAKRSIVDVNGFDSSGDFNYTSQTSTVEGTQRTFRVSTHQYEQSGTVIFTFSAI